MSPTQIARITSLQRTFAEVDASPLDRWIDDFSRDHDPDREIAIYETMAQAYTSYCSRHPLSPEARNEVYSLALLRSGAPDDEVLQHAHLRYLRREDAVEFLRGYGAAPRPVTVSY